MSRIRPILARLQSVFRRAAIEREMAAEMQAHLELQAEANRARGMDAAEATYAARRQFGGVAQVQERCREQRGIPWIENVRRDLRFAARALCKAPGFTLAVVASLTIGLGATTAIVNIGRWVVFPPIPFPEPDRLVIVNNVDATVAPQVADEFPFFSFPSLFASLREGATSFAALGGVRGDTMNLLMNGEPRPAEVRWVTTDLFSALGTRVLKGRLFQPEEYTAAGDTVILSAQIWEQDYHADTGILGREIALGGKLRRVVGVLPSDFVLPERFLKAGGFYLPEVPSPTAPLFPYTWLQVVGRLKSGVALEQAASELALLHRRNSAWLNTQSLDRNTPRLAPLPNYYRRGGNSRYWLFFGAAALLYAIACSNAASLMLAHAVTRRRELGVRLALGGSRWQIARLLLAESLLLTLLGGGLGLAVANWAAWAWTAFGGARPPFDSATVFISGLAGSLTCVGVALVPILRVRRADVNAAMQEGSGTLGDSRRLGRLRAGFVVAQAALAVTLLVGTGLLVRSFGRLQRVDFGFDPTDKLAVFGTLPEGVAPDASLQGAERLRQGLAVLPGVQDVTTSGLVPLTNGRTMMEIKIDGRPELGSIMFSYNRVSPEYFATLGVPILSGRGFAGSKAGDPPVAVINQTAARRYFGAESPIGKRLDLDQHGMWEIVGVVGDVREGDRREAIRPQFYFPVSQPPFGFGFLSAVLRMNASPCAGFEALVRRAAFEADPRLVVRVHHLSDNAAATIKSERDTAVVLQVLSCLALVLAALGLFSVLAYAVAQRQRELGVRMALGAAPGDLLRMVFLRGLRLAGFGLVLGLGAAAGLTRFLRSMLFETNPQDPLIFSAVAVGLLGVAALACWLPARRAATVDPMISLRAE